MLTSLRFLLLKTVIQQPLAMIHNSVHTLWTASPTYWWEKEGSRFSTGEKTGGSL